MNRSNCCNRHRFPPVPTASLYSPKRRSPESSQAHTQNHHTRRRGAGTASRSLPPRAHSCRPLSMRTRSSRARRISAAWSSIPVRAAARVSDSSSTSIVNRIEPSSTRIEPIFTIRRCTDQNPSTLMHCSQQKSRATPSRDPATASSPRTLPSPRITMCQTLVTYPINRGLIALSTDCTHHIAQEWLRGAIQGDGQSTPVAVPTTALH